MKYYKVVDKWCGLNFLTHQEQYGIFAEIGSVLKSDGTTIWLKVSDEWRETIDTANLIEILLENKQILEIPSL